LFRVSDAEPGSCFRKRIRSELDHQVHREAAVHEAGLLGSERFLPGETDVVGFSGRGQTKTKGTGDKIPIETGVCRAPVYEVTCLESGDGRESASEL